MRRIAAHSGSGRHRGDVERHRLAAGEKAAQLVAGQRQSRRATPREQAGARTPYRAPVAPPVGAEPDDEQLSDEEALRLCRLE